jgi:ABC-type phosphate transport system substrate-binding protein
MKKVVVLALVLALVPVLAVRPAVGQQGYRVIVNKDNPTTTLSRSEVSKYLLKKKTQWDHGPKASPVDLAGDSSVREVFSEDVHGRSVALIQRYWQKQIFSGRGVPPPEVANDDEVIKLVNSDKGAIGYVSPGARLPDDVKVLSIVADG